MHESSYQNMKLFVKEYLDKNQKLDIVDIGSQDVQSATGDSSYKPLFDSSNWKYIGCDMEKGYNVDVVLSNIYDWKEIKSSSIDVVISGQAFEHIEFFWVTMSEISRIMKEGAICCIIAPSAGVLHKYPLDCWRFYEDGFSALARYVGLELVSVQTQRNRFDFSEFDPCWQDTILIAKKPYLSLRQKIEYAIHNKYNKILVSKLNMQVSMPNVFNSQLFYEVNGTGYSEDNSLHTIINKHSDGEYTVKFDLSHLEHKKMITSLRFDPTNEPIRFKVEKIVVIDLSGATHELSVSKTNGIISNNYYVFSNSDPILEFDISELDVSLIEYIRVEGKCFSCKETDLLI